METGVRILSEQDINTLSSTKQVQYGAQGVTEDGREFRYCSFGGTTTVHSGMFLQAAVAAANSQALTITATTVAAGGQITANLALGSTQLVITNSSTAVTQDEFAEGFLEVIVGASGSVTDTYSYRIKGNTAAAASTGYITVYLAEALRNTTALVPGTDTVNLWTSPYQAAIITTTVNVPIGLAIIPAVNTSTVTNYGWVQTKGDAVAVGDGSSIVIGNTIGPSTTTSGLVGLAVTTTKPPIGWARATTSTATANVAITLNL